MAAKMTRTQTAAATLMPAFALVERPVFGEETGVVEIVGLTVARETVFDGRAVDVPAVLLAEVAVLVVNSVRSVCWNSTLIGWPHMMIGPVTVVLFNVASLRAGTTVLPLASG